MDDGSRKLNSDLRKALFAAFLISLLINFVFIISVVSNLIPKVPSPPEKTEIVLMEEKKAADEPGQPQEKEEKATTQEKTSIPNEPRSLASPRQPIPEKNNAPIPDNPYTEPEGVPEGPVLEEPLAKGQNQLEGPPKQLNTKLSWSSFESAFSAQSAKDLDDWQQKSMEKRRGALKLGSLTGKVKKAIYNSRSWVAQGEQVPLGNKAKIFHNYLELAHDRIHALFANSFLASLNSLDPKDPLNDISLMATMEFEILESGQVNEIRVIKTSGNSVFDAAAVDSLYRSSPFPQPPKSILSWNNRVYFRWGFYRNNRMCGVFNAEPYLLRAPGASPEAIPEDKLRVIDS